MINPDTQRKLIFLLFFITLSIPFVIPFNLPIAVTKPTLDVYNTIESMPNGSIAFIDFDFGVMSYPELYPQALALLKQAVNKHFKFVIATFDSSEGVIYAKQALSEVDLSGYKYGEDYVHLGYYAGAATSLTAFAQDIHRLITVDVDGRPIDNMPLMQKLKTASDFDIWLVGHYTSLIFVTVIAGPYKAKMVCTTDSGGFVSLLPYYLSGQIKGALNGARGAAEYENLLGYVGQGNMLTNVMSFSHVFLLLAIITGNVIYWTGRRSNTK